MRVTIVSESFPPDINGVAHSVVRVAEHLVDRGHQVLVIAPEPASGTARVAGLLPYPVVRVPSVPLHCAFFPRLSLSPLAVLKPRWEKVFATLALMAQ